MPRRLDRYRLGNHDLWYGRRARDRAVGAVNPHRGPRPDADPAAIRQHRKVLQSDVERRGGATKKGPWQPSAARALFVARGLLRQGGEQQQRDDVGDLDHRVHRRAGGVLVGIRSEERRVGKGGVSPGRFWWSSYHLKKKKTEKIKREKHSA